MYRELSYLLPPLCLFFAICSTLTMPPIHTDTVKGSASPSRGSDLLVPHVEDYGLFEKPVPVKGRGVFATKDIPAGVLVLKFEGPIYDRETCPEFSEAIQVSVRGGQPSLGFCYRFL